MSEPKIHQRLYARIIRMHVNIKKTPQQRTAWGELLNVFNERIKGDRRF